VDRAIDKALEKLVALARKLFGRGRGREAQAPIEERWKKGMAELDRYLSTGQGKEKRISDLKKGLAPIQSRFGFTKLAVIRQGAEVSIDAQMNPRQVKGVSDRGLIDEEHIKQTIRPEGAKGALTFEWKASARGAEHFYCKDSEQTEWHWRKGRGPTEGRWIASAAGRKQQEEAEKAARKKIQDSIPHFKSIVSEEKALTHSGLDVAGLAPGATPEQDRLIIGEAKFLGGKQPQSVKYVPPESVGKPQPSGRIRENPLSATTDRLQANLLRAMGTTRDEDLVSRVSAALKAGNVEVIYFLAGQAYIPAAKLKKIEERIRSELHAFLRAQFQLKDDEARAVVAKVTVRAEKL
jgi:hypothetical protein